MSAADKPAGLSAAGAIVDTPQMNNAAMQKT
jgi:hypothetical protein